MSTVLEPRRKKQKPAQNRRGPRLAPPNLAPARANAFAKGFDWPVVLWLSFLHVGAISAAFFVTWQAVVTALVMVWVTGMVGVTLGFHRLLTHNSFVTYKPIRWALAFIGGLAGEGSAITWVATHRKHHMYSDQPEDPHSPRDGGWWSHMLWLGPNRGREYYRDLIDRFAPDLYRDPVMRFLDKTFLLWHWVLGFAFFGVGYAMGGAYMAWSFVAWGIFLRLVYVLHITWFVNSASHMWGYRNYATTDDSRNLWWVGLTAFGEGWHNNHHAHQRMARHGHKWWEFDQTYWCILAMEKLGLAWKVVKDIPSDKDIGK